jgi:hypothetical protein
MRICLGLGILMLCGCETLSFRNSNAEISPEDDLENQSVEESKTIEDPVQPLYPIIGAIEMVSLRELPFRMEARVDTGATTSSIDARKIKAFERDGEQWVRFEVHCRNNKASIEELELPVSRIAHIEQHGKDHKRYVVNLTLRIGDEPDFIVSEFTLRSRKFFDFPMLLGRNVLEGNYLVDSAGEFLLGQP